MSEKAFANLVQRMSKSADADSDTFTGMARIHDLEDHCCPESFPLGKLLICIQGVTRVRAMAQGLL